MYMYIYTSFIYVYIYIYIYIIYIYIYHLKATNDSTKVLQYFALNAIKRVILYKKIYVNYEIYSVIPLS